MKITNHIVLIKPEETAADVMYEICDDLNIGLNEPFAFSAILLPDKDNPEYYKLKLNCIDPPEDNPYTPTELVSYLYRQEPNKSGVRYIQPPLEQWLTTFRPLLVTLINRVHPRYEQLIPNREEMLSILYLTIVKLYTKGYYLHQTLLKKSYINELNMECRKLKGLSNIDSLDAAIDKDDDGKDISLYDQVSDTESTAWARQTLLYTDSDYKSDLFEKVRDRMLQDMSQLAFDRILMQLKYGTIDRNTSYQLDKYRQIFCPSYVPRPNAKGKPKGGCKR